MEIVRVRVRVTVRVRVGVRVFNKAAIIVIDVAVSLFHAVTATFQVIVFVIDFIIIIEIIMIAATTTITTTTTATSTTTAGAFFIISEESWQMVVKSEKHLASVLGLGLVVRLGSGYILIGPTSKPNSNP
jgi:hypothetical protein